MLTDRIATQNDYSFLYDLKVTVLRSGITQTFGWDDHYQIDNFQQEWQEAKPHVIEWDGQPIGCYLLQPQQDYLYFGRFYLLPEHQKKGFGRHILNRVIKQADRLKLPITLLYLKIENLHHLYEKFGFKTYKTDENFVYMIKEYSES